MRKARFEIVRSNTQDEKKIRIHHEQRSKSTVYR